MKFVIVLCTIAVASFAQNFNLGCGFTCSRNTVVQANIDGAPGTATCSQNVSAARCSGCCEARALQEGLTSGSASGFVSNDGRSCVCCINNSRCGNTFDTFGKK